MLESLKVPWTGNKMWTLFSKNHVYRGTGTKEAEKDFCVYSIILWFCVFKNVPVGLCVCVFVCVYLYVFVLSIYHWKAKKEPVTLLVYNGSASYLTALCFVTVAPICSVFTVTVWPLYLDCRLYLQEKTHSLWDWFKPAHSVCCCYSSQHFMEVWHYWSGVLICHCSASFPWPCLYSICHTVAIHPLGLSRWMESCCSRNHFCASSLTLWLHCWWFYLTFLCDIWDDLSWPFRW